MMRRMTTKLAIYVIAVACAQTFLAVTTAQAAVVNPDGFESYTPTSSWVPSQGTEGWTKSGFQTGATVAITATGGYGSSHGMTVTDPTGYNAQMNWFWVLDKTTYPHQTWQAKFRATAHDSGGIARLFFSPGTATSWEYPGSVEMKVSNASAKLYPGGIDLPGGTSLTYNTWYTVELEVNYTTLNVRARFGPSGGAMYAWTSWIAMNPDGFSGGVPIQPTQFRVAANGSVDVDYVTALSLAANPDDFERYTPTSNWVPGPSADGWQKGAFQAGDSVAIVSGGGYGGSQSMRVTEPTGLNATMYWMLTLDKTTCPRQTWRAKFRFANSGNDTRFTFAPQAANSWEYPGNVEFNNPGASPTAKLYPGGTDLPGGSSLAYNTWYTVELELDYTTGQVRARFGPSGGTFNNWTSWTAMSYTIQPIEFTLAFNGTVDVDDISGDVSPDQAANFKFSTAPSPNYTALDDKPFEVIPPLQVQGNPLRVSWTSSAGAPGAADYINFVNQATGTVALTVGSLSSRWTSDGQGSYYIKNIVIDSLPTGDYEVRLINGSTGSIKGSDLLSITAPQGQLYCSAINGVPWTGNPQSITIARPGNFDVSWNLTGCRIAGPVICITSPSDPGTLRMHLSDDSYAYADIARLCRYINDPEGNPFVHGVWTWRTVLNSGDFMTFDDFMGDNPTPLGWIRDSKYQGTSNAKVNMNLTPGTWRLWIATECDVIDSDVWAVPKSSVLTVNVQ